MALKPISLTVCGARVLRQGSSEDAMTWARHSVEYEREEVGPHMETGFFGGYDDTGRAPTRWRRDVYVSPDELRVLGTDEAVVWAPPLGRNKRRSDRVRIAPPTPPRALPATARLSQAA
jgi:hypothetical protein